MTSSCNLAEISSYLDKFELISFDVFDTLLVRSVPSSEDVFLIVEEIAKTKEICISNFSKKRKQAEETAKELYENNPTLGEIYKTLSETFEVPLDVSSRLEKLEIQIEQRILIAREDIKVLFNSLISKKKKVILVSDMYLSSELIRRILIHQGFLVQECEIFVSCEFRANKASGALWKLLKNRMQSLSWIHLGDDVIGDTRVPSKYGVNVLPFRISINSPKDSFLKNAVFRERLGKYLNGTIADRILLGEIISGYLFNNAFRSKKQDKQSLSAVGAWVGPILTEFMDFISKKGKGKCLLFVTREGYILKPLFEHYSKKIGLSSEKAFLFYTSRVSSSLANATSFEEFSKLVETPFEGTMREFFINKLGILPPQVEEDRRRYKLPSEKRSFLQQIHVFYPFIKKEADKQNQLFREYLKEVVGKEEPCIVDIGFSGRTQYNLATGCKTTISGIYLMLDKFHLIGKNYCPEEHLLSTPNLIYDNLPFFEASLQVREQSVLRLEKNSLGVISPVLSNEELVSPIVTDAFSSIKDFVCCMGGWKASLGGNFQLSKGLGEQVWMALLEEKILPENYIKNLMLEDKFSGLGVIQISKLRRRKPISPSMFKYRLKNLVKTYIPLFAYNAARDVWIRYFK